jgi:NAD(P)-dependent dehydrogenase (short-subunit alcohol dehydrogenase family)
MSTGIVLVTGAAGSIGRAICRRFLLQGETVVALDVNAARLKRVPRQLRPAPGKLVTIVADVTDEASIRRAARDIDRTVGAVSVLVNNAGGNRTTLIAETTPLSWRADIELNLNSAFYLCRALLPGMLKRRQGCIINIGSVNGLAVYSDPAYSAAKAGLIHFTKFLATEFGRRGIRSNVVCPGTVRTEAWTKMLKRKPELFARLTDLCPLGEIATPDDVAAAVCFLASDDARRIHGSVLVVDGGLTAGNAAVMSAFATQDVP